ncbi:MAG: carbon-nitrogen hydrolase family protein [Chloroflexi bacterium]|nr:carbon-nitrogen hydrolase family protein [Chloroflexota bacterium]
MRLAAVQFFATPFALERNLYIAERLVRDAAEQGAAVVALPEMYNTGYVYSSRLAQAAEGPEGLTLRWMKRLSAELDVVLGGALLLAQGGRVRNVFVLMEPDGAIHQYAKRHPFMWERLYFSPGRRPLIAATSAGRIGLLTCWDIAHWGAAAAYRGNVDALLVSSAPPRFHRAVLNFPLGRKVYLAELMPALLADRAAIDEWYAGEVGRLGLWVGAPVAHAVMSGRFVTKLPWPRLSFLAAALGRPKYWGWVSQAHLASLRATFYASPAVSDARGRAVAWVEAEEGVPMADVAPGASGDLPPMPPDRYFLANVPRLLRWVDRLTGADYFPYKFR